MKLLCAKANINLTLGMADTYPSKSYIFENYGHLLNSFRSIVQNGNRGTTSDVKKKGNEIDSYSLSV